MKKIFILSIIITLLGLSGCYKDKGNYNYKTMPEVTVTNIESNYIFSVASIQRISPQITIKNGEISNPGYTWRIDGQVISEEKDLDFVVSGLPVRSGLYSDFTITDLDTGIEYITTFSVAITSEFQTGWVMLADDGSRSVLHYMRDDGEFYEDVYRTINDEDLSPKPQALAEHFLPYSSELGQIFVACQGDPNYSVELDGATFLKMVRTSDEFVDEMPTGFKPMNLHSVMNYDYLISNGKLYVRYVEESFDALYQDGLFPNFPYPGNYQLSSWITRGSFIFSNDIIVFDNSTNSYLLVRNGEMSRFDYVNDPNQKFLPYDMSKQLLYGGPTATEPPADYYVTFLKDNTNGKAYVHRFYFTGWGAKSYRSTSEVEFPESNIIGNDTRFAICQNRPYAYISSGTSLYVYNYNDNSVRKLRDFGRNIRNIAICRANYERLGVVIENTDPGKSDFFELDVSVVGDGKSVMSKEGMQGRVVDIIYKLGDQWVTY